MTTPRQRQREVLEIVIAATGGDATAEQLALLNQLIVNDETLRAYVVELLNQEAWLAWHGSRSETDNALADNLLADVAAIQFEALPRTKPATESGFRKQGARSGWWSRDFAGTKSDIRNVGLSRKSSALRAAVLILVGALVGLGTSRLLPWFIHRSDTSTGTARSQVRSSDESAATTPYLARLVQGTACVWDGNTVPTLGINGGLRGGEVLNLREGLADLEMSMPTGGSAKMQIEGPAKMILTAKGAPSLSFGKFSTCVSAEFGDFVFETPCGKVVVSEDSSLGIAVFGTQVEVHVFSGRAVVASPWSSESGSPDQFKIGGGQSMRFSTSESGQFQVERHNANPDFFASQVPMASDQLSISPDYVNDVLRASPLLYWRFNGAPDGFVRNEVGDHFRGKVVGSPRWVHEGDNEAIEFGANWSDTAQKAYVKSADSFDGLLSGSYSVELWAKPSHFHLGTLVAFVKDSPVEGDFGMHGMLLELGGAVTMPTLIEHPGRIRFLHRDPPSADVMLGTSCFSHTPYELRRWTHVVAVKDGSAMRLYMNGELMATGREKSELSKDLFVMIGQLDEQRTLRAFIGELDELAIYNHALSADDIRQHYQHVRAKAEGPSI
jgi:Concanavalin A-like lectin/glucanases superfamily